MKKICLFFFSGTGLTEYIVSKLTNELIKCSNNISCFKIEEANVLMPSLSGYDILGIAYPIHSFNAPKIVVDFAKQLPKAAGVDTFILHTAGEDHILNYAASGLLINILRKKGYRVFYNRLIEMPSNFIVKYSDEKVKGILCKANEDMYTVATDIMESRNYSIRSNLGSKIVSFIGRAEWFGAHIMGKLYYTGISCVRCERCINVCPNKNIEMNKKSVRFKWRCGLCMRCIYQCPSNSISIRQPFKFLRFNKWYDEKMFKIKIIQR